MVDVIALYLKPSSFIDKISTDYKSTSLYDSNIEYSSVSGTWPDKYPSYVSTIGSTYPQY
ncbi:hypothetical protein ACF0H5_004688 [Mactra antiquata]